VTEAGDARMRRIAEEFPGPQGQRGPRGRRGPESARRMPSVAYLFLLNCALILAGYFFLAHAVRTDSQQRCGGISQQVAIPVPVPTAGNPSRAWVARFSQIERQRGAELGCHMPPPRFVHVPGGN
jgi:hypothetical protein